MITAILNCYRRPQNLEEQINALLEQTLKPEQIWIWMNHSKELSFFDWGEVESLIEKHNIRTVPSNYNWKYCGRFALACLVNTEYTAIFDDDTIPGPKWLENCMEHMPEEGAILGGIGLILHSEYTYDPHTRYGWASKNEEPVEVDLVGHAWTFPAHFAREYFWREKPFWDNGEDMHFSAMAQKYGNKKTIVPPHHLDEISSSLKGYELVWMK
jgi:hypothetical protein